MFHTAVSAAAVRQRMAQVPNATTIFKPISDSDLVRAVRGVLSQENPTS